MAGRARVSDPERAVRINMAAELLAAGVPTGDAAKRLARGFAVSVRQGHRYVEQAAQSGAIAVPEPSVVFTVKLPASLADRVRDRARDTGVTISALVTSALTDVVSKTRARRPGR